MSFFDQVEKHDALCILPLNIVNEKIYIFLWFWLLLLGCLSTLVVAYRLGQMSCKKCSLWKIWLYVSVCLFLWLNIDKHLLSVIVLSPKMRAYLLYIRWDCLALKQKRFLYNWIPSRQRLHLTNDSCTMNHSRKKTVLKQISLPRFRLIKREVVNTLVKKSKMGDWFLFYMLGQNVDSMIFKEVRYSKIFKDIQRYSER